MSNGFDINSLGSVGPIYVTGANPVANSGTPLTAQEAALRSKMLDVVHNTFISRLNFLSQTFGPNRDVFGECGWPAIDAYLECQLFRNLYDRDGIASRVVDVMPDECWQVQPQVYEDEDNDTQTPFEQAWDALGSMLTNNSAYKDEAGSPVWEYLKRIDKASGIGRFGLLLLGIDDGQLLETPITPRFVDSQPEVNPELKDSKGNIKTSVGEGKNAKPIEPAKVQVTKNQLEYIANVHKYQEDLREWQKYVANAKRSNVNPYDNSESYPEGAIGDDPDLEAQESRKAQRPDLDDNGNPSDDDDTGDQDDGQTSEQDDGDIGGEDSDTGDDGDADSIQLDSSDDGTDDEYGDQDSDSAQGTESDSGDSGEDGVDQDEFSQDPDDQDSGVGQDDDQLSMQDHTDANDVDGQNADRTRLGDGRGSYEALPGSEDYTGEGDGTFSNGRNPFADSSVSDITGVSTIGSQSGSPMVLPIGTSGTDAQYQGVQFAPMMPDDKGKDPNGPYKLLFLRPYDESLVQIVQYEADMRNPRFGLPVMYLVTLNDPRNPHTGVGLPLATVRVHWSRVVHIADTRLTSEIFGYPRMQRVYNRLLDIIKLYGASAEGYWRGAFPGLSIETNPMLGGDVAIDKSQLDAALQEYFNGMNRALALTGMSAHSLATQVVDPENQIHNQLQALCIYIGIPLRIFMGSERGELASSMDLETWNHRVVERQKNYLTPRLIVPFIDRLIDIGILPRPSEYHIDWPEIDWMTETEKAQKISTLTMALGSFLQGNCQSLITPLDWFVHIWGMDEETVKQFLENAQSHLQEVQQAQEQGDGSDATIPGNVPQPPQPENPFGDDQDQEGQGDEGDQGSDDYLDQDTSGQQDQQPFVGEDDDQQ